MTEPFPVSDDAWANAESHTEDMDPPDTYIGTYVPKGIEDDPTGRQPYDLL